MKEPNDHADTPLRRMASLGLAGLQCRLDGSLVAVTPAAARFFGSQSAEEVEERAKRPYRPWEAPDEVSRWLSGESNAGTDVWECAVVGPDEVSRPVLLHKAAVPPGEADPGCVYLVAVDAADMRSQQERRLQIARFESIGSSCGAVGHKLNNLLAGLLGYMTLLRRGISGESETVLRYLASLDETGTRFHDLTKQLLVIAQKNISYSMQPVELPLVMDLAVENARTSKPDLVVTFDDSEVLPKVEADNAALQEAFEHLILGAALVLPGPAHVEVSFTVETVEPDAARVLAVQPGAYAVAQFRHTHAPIQGIVRERLFDPYFTFDGKGKGDELGLSKAWGIVSLHKGTVSVTAEGAEGTRIRAYLPATPRRR